MMMRMLPSLPNFWQTLVYVGQYLREYAGVLWDPVDAASIQELEAVQNRAIIIRFVKSIHSRRHGIIEGRTAPFGLQGLKDRRKFHRFAQTTKRMKNTQYFPQLLVKL